MDRYDLVTKYQFGTSVEEMERADRGEWIRYEDHEAALVARLVALRSEIQRVMVDLSWVRANLVDGREQRTLDAAIDRLEGLYEEP